MSWMTRCLVLCATVVGGGTCSAQSPVLAKTTPADERLARYFQVETRRVADKCLAEIGSGEVWNARVPEYRRQLREMIGLDPLPERTPLNAVVEGTFEHEGFVVERIQFQSRPGLYVTANLYRPKEVKEPLPTILYVCGHGLVKKEGVSFGNKTHYQHHGAWYARNGYVCLVIDTIQLGEIEGLHHGTYRYNQWWWNSRGYSPAGVEAWNGMRALDYLETRPEVDKTRFGVTGRSGGGAYSWYLAALDERIKVAVPTAGITDLENHVVDGVVEGHCDCMYFVNTYEWDYPMLAALVAPRALLISNTDKDGIFPLEGVMRTHDKVRRVYRALGAGAKLGVQITEGGHADTQELHIHAFRWFNRFLKGDEKSQVTIPAEKLFPPEQLKVFASLPTDERVTTAQEWFVPTATTKRVTNADEFRVAKEQWNEGLRTRVFRNWPGDAAAAFAGDGVKEIAAQVKDGVRWLVLEFESEHDTPLRLYLALPEKPNANKLVVLTALDEAGWGSFAKGYGEVFPELPPVENGATSEEWKPTAQMVAKMGWGMAWLAPRGIGPTAWTGGEHKQAQIQRRFQLLGRTLDSLRVWDLARGAAVLRSRPELVETPLWLQGETPSAAVWSLYAALFVPNVARVDLHHLPISHREGPDFFNVLRVLEIPDTALIVGENTNVRLYGHNRTAWEPTLDRAKSLGWDAKRIEYRELPPPSDVKLADVTISVTYNDKPVPHGEFTLESDDTGLIVAPVRAGRVELPVYRGLRPGLPVGKYRVAVRAAGGVPQRYGRLETSALVAEVEEGANTLEFSLKD